MATFQTHPPEDMMIVLVTEKYESFYAKKTLADRRMSTETAMIDLAKVETWPRTLRFCLMLNP